MITRKQIILLAVLIVAAVAGYFGWAAWRADKNLVTLDVRNMDVHDVVAKLERNAKVRVLLGKDFPRNPTLVASR